MDNTKPSFILVPASQSAKTSLVGKEAVLIGSPSAAPGTAQLTPTKELTNFGRSYEVFGSRK